MCCLGRCPRFYSIHSALCTPSTHFHGALGDQGVHLSTHTRSRARRARWCCGRGEGSRDSLSGHGGPGVSPPRYEDFLNRYVHGEQNLFIGVQLQLSKPTEPSTLLAAARNAWTALRYSVPTVALATTQDADDNTLMCYGVPQDSAEVAHWADRTTFLHGPGVDLDTLRVELGKLTLPFANGDQTFLHFVPSASDSLACSQYGVLLHTHHTPFDGAGTRILMSRFLALLAQALDAPSGMADRLRALRWGGETANLLPAYCSVVAESEPLSGPLYDETLGAILQGFKENLPRKHGYRPRGEGISIGRRMEHRFSEDETTRIIEFVRHHGLTVNHLVHAAVFLSALVDNPPTDLTPADASFFTFGLTDCRSRLAPPYNEDPKAYPGYCLGISGVNVPLSLVTGETAAARLLSVANAIKDEYAKDKACPALLGVIAQEIDIVIDALKTGPPPDPWMGPWYAGDGIGERYLDPAYANADGTAEVLRVLDFFTSLNQIKPGPYFRSYSWSGRLIISVDHNAAAMPAEDCEGFLRCVVEMVLAMI